MSITAPFSQQGVGVRCLEDERRQFSVDVDEIRTEDREGALRVLLDGDGDYDGLVVDGLKVIGAELLGHGCI